MSAPARDDHRHASATSAARAAAPAPEFASSAPRAATPACGACRRAGAAARDPGEVRQHERRDPDADAGGLVQRAKHRRQVHADHRAGDEQLQHAERDATVARPAAPRRRLAAAATPISMPNRCSTSEHGEHAVGELHVHRARATTSGSRRRAGSRGTPPRAPGYFAVSPPITTASSASAAPANAPRIVLPRARRRAARSSPPSPPARITVADRRRDEAHRHRPVRERGEGRVAELHRDRAEQRRREAERDGEPRRCAARRRVRPRRAPRVAATRRRSSRDER